MAELAEAENPRPENPRKEKRLPRKSGKLGRILVLIVIVAVLAVGGFLLWRYLNTYESTDDARRVTRARKPGSSVSFTGAGKCVIDANQAGNSVYAPVPTASQTIGNVADPGSPQVSATIAVGYTPIGVGVDPSSGTVYVGNHDSNSLSVISLETSCRRPLVWEIFLKAWELTLLPRWSTWRTSGTTQCRPSARRAMRSWPRSRSVIARTE